MPASSAVADGDTMIEDTDDGWTWTGMISVKGAGYHGGTVHAGGPGTAGVYVFEGSGVTLYSLHGADIKPADQAHPLGKLKISIDGKEKETVDLAAAQADSNVKVFTVTGLSGGMHVLQIKPIGGWGVVDRITVEKPSIADDGGKDYFIFPRSSPDRYLDTENRALVDDTAATITDSVSGHDQIWRVYDLGNGKFRISPRARPSQALTVMSRKTPPSEGGICTLCGLYPYTGATAQLWIITPFAGGYCKVSSALDGTCLNVMGADSRSGAHVIAFRWQNGGGTNDQWFFRPVDK